MTAPIAWWDEFGFLKYNMTIYTAASPATSQAAKEAKSNGKPYCKMITTTPGDMSTEYGRDAYDFKLKCAMFREEFYSWDIEDVRQFVDINSTNGFFNIIFSYKQLGRDSKYFDEMVTELAGNMFKVRREVLLEWVSMAEECPFNPDAIEKLQGMSYSQNESPKPIYINNYYVLTQYKQQTKGVPVILSCDVGSGGRRDFSTIAVIDSRTKECIAEFNNNKVDTLEFSDIIYTLASNKDLFPDCMIVIERNNVGASVIGNLLRTDIRNKLYYEVMNNELQEKIKNGRYVDNATDSRNYGLWTNEVRREEMMELLVKYVHYYPHRIRTPILVSQICGLVFNKKGRIDHKPNEHDDMVMGYLIGIWVLNYGKNIGKYGIIRLPDVDPETGMTEEEAYAQALLNEHEKAKKLTNTYQQINTVPEKKIEVSQFKTTKDYYAEIDRERERAYDISNSGHISLERSLLGGNNTTYERFGQSLGGAITNHGEFGRQLIGSLIDGDF